MKYMNNSILKSTIIVTFFSIISLAFSFLSQLIIAYYFGTNNERDAYFLASSVPTYLIAIINGSIGIVFIPKYLDYYSQKVSEEISSSFIISYLFSIFIFSGLITGGIYFFSKELLFYLAPTLSNNQLFLTERLLKILIPTFTISAINYTLISFLQIKGFFTNSSLVQLFIPILSILFTLLFNKTLGISSLAIGTLLGNIIIFTVLLYFCSQLIIFNKKINLDFYIIYKIAWPLLFSGIIFRSTNFIERIISANLGSKYISYLGYSGQLYLLLTTIATSGIAVTIYPKLSQLWKVGDKTDFVNTFQKGIQTIIFITIPIAIYIIFFRNEFVAIIFQRGEFSANDTVNVALALSLTMLAFFSQCLGSIIVKVFYIANKTISISIISTLELLIYVVLTFLFLKKYSFLSLSIALSVSSFVSILVSTIFINKRIIKLNLKKHLKTLVIVLLISILSTFVPWLINKIFSINNVYMNFLFFASLTVLLYISLSSYFLDDFRKLSTSFYKQLKSKFL